MITNESRNQLVDELYSKSISKPNKWLIKQSTNQSIDAFWRLMRQSIKKFKNQLVNLCINWAINKSFNRWVIESISL